MCFRLRELLVGVLLLNLSGCALRFEAVQADELRILWNDSLRDSAASWWYAGRDSEYQYIVLKKPLDVRGFRVRAEAIQLVGIRETPVTDEPKKWVNLKADHISFQIP